MSFVVSPEFGCFTPEPVQTEGGKCPMWGLGKCPGAGDSGTVPRTLLEGFGLCSPQELGLEK